MNPLTKDVIEYLSKRKDKYINIPTIYEETIEELEVYFRQTAKRIDLSYQARQGTI